MKKSFISLIVLMMLFPLIVNAATEDVSIVCDSKKLAPGAQTTCYIKGDFSKKISSFHGELSADTNLTISDITKSGWEGRGDNGIIDLYTDVNKTGIFNFITFAVKADSNVNALDKKIYLKNITISDDSFTENTISNKNYDIRITSTDNYLKLLSLNNANILFDKDTLIYNVELNADKTIISAEANDINAAVSGDIGEKSISYGKNEFNIIVISESNVKRTYKIIINRPSPITTKNNPNKATKTGKNSEKNIDNPHTGSNAKYFILFIIPIVLVLYILLRRKNKFVLFS